MARIAEVFILAGGLGTRLRSVVSDRAKSAAIVAGRPFLSHVLGQIDASGICKHVTLCVGHLAESVEQEYGERFGNLKVRYSRETQPLGTGGALRQALHTRLSQTNGASPVIAMNGDTYLSLNWSSLVESHALSKADLTFALTYAHDSRRFGTVKVEGDVPTAFIEKGATRSGWVNGGIYVLGKKAQARIAALPTQCSLEHDFFATALTEFKCHAYRSRARFIDIGIPDDFARAQRILK